MVAPVAIPNRASGWLNSLGNERSVLTPLSAGLEPTRARSITVFPTKDLKGRTSFGKNLIPSTSMLVLVFGCGERYLQ